MDPLTFAIPGAIKGALGLGQLIGGSLMKVKRPEYEIPDVAKEELAMSRMMANGRMPGVNYANMRIDQNAASAAYRTNRAATNPNQILAAQAGIQMNADIAGRGLMEAEAGDQYRRLANLSRSLRMMSDFKDKEFELNKMQPYQDKARTKAALVQGGLLNLFGGVGEGMSGIMAGKMMQDGAGAAAGSQTATPQAGNPFGNIMKMAGGLSQYMRRPIDSLQQPQLQQGDVAPMQGPQDFTSYFMQPNWWRLKGWNKSLMQTY
jgi:hypothetical protein